jgi:hypothetical protein
MENIQSKYTTFEQSQVLNELFRFPINHFDTVFIKRNGHVDKRRFFGIVIEKQVYPNKDLRFGIKEYTDNNNIQLIKHDSTYYNEKIIRAFSSDEIDKILFTCEIKGVKYDHMTTYENTVILVEGVEGTTRNNLVMSSDISLLDAKTNLLIELANEGFISY